MGKGVGVLLILVGFGFVLVEQNVITGNVIGLKISQSYLSVVGILFFLAGLALLISSNLYKKISDYLLALD